MDAANSFHLKKISRDWNWEMLRVLGESPIEAPGMSVVFDRRPDIFALPGLFSDRTECAGFFRDRDLVGFAMLMYQRRYVNGEPRSVAYLGNVHVVEEARRRGFGYRAGSLLFGEMRGWADLGYTVIMAGNEAAERFIGRNRPDYPDLPRSRVIAALRAKSILVMGRRRESGACRVRRAELRDVDAIVGLLSDEFKPRLFAPVIDRETFLDGLAGRPGCGLDRYYVAERDGAVVGTCAAWETGTLKQTRIVRYGWKLRWLRQAHSAAAGLLGFPPMPAEGGTVREATVTDCAVKGRDPELMEALLIAVHNEFARRKYNMLIFGSCAQDPLLRAARGFVGPTTVSSVVLLAREASWLAEGAVDTALPYIDLVML